MTDKKQVAVVLDADPAEALIEKIARAICGTGADELTYIQIEPGVHEPYGPRWVHFRDQARDALTAIRDSGIPIGAGKMKVFGYGQYSPRSGKMSIVISERKAKERASRFSDKIFPLLRQCDADVWIAIRDENIKQLNVAITSANEAVARLNAERDQIAQETREACAKACEELMRGLPVRTYDAACRDCAEAIRKGGEKV